MKTYGTEQYSDWNRFHKGKGDVSPLKQEYRMSNEETRKKDTNVRERNIGIEQKISTWSENNSKFKDTPQEIQQKRRTSWQSGRDETRVMQRTRANLNILGQRDKVWSHTAWLITSNDIKQIKALRNGWNTGNEVPSSPEVYLVTSGKNIFLQQTRNWRRYLWRIEEGNI